MGFLLPLLALDQLIDIPTMGEEGQRPYPGATLFCPYAESRAIKKPDPVKDPANDVIGTPWLDTPTE